MTRLIRRRMGLTMYPLSILVKHRQVQEPSLHQIAEFYHRQNHLSNKDIWFATYHSHWIRWEAWLASLQTKSYWLASNSAFSIAVSTIKLFLSFRLGICALRAGVDNEFISLLLYFSWIISTNLHVNKHSIGKILISQQNQRDPVRHI
jgi:hypothetical protein